MENIKEASFTSIWDGGIAVTTDCKVNLDTKEVFAIEKVEVAIEKLECLDAEWVEIDGEQYPVYNAEEPVSGEFWYK